MANSVTSNLALTEAALQRTDRALQLGAIPQSSLTRAIALDPVELNLVEEGLRLGAEPGAVANLVFEHRYGRRSALTAAPASSARTLSLLESTEETVSDRDRLNAILTELEPYITAYRQEVVQEFYGLSGGVQAAFDQSPDNYLQLRPLYYADGYRQPAEQIFADIQPYTFLGHKVAGGLHTAMAQRLTQAKEILDGWEPGLSAEMGKLFKSIGGFVPRTIAGSTVLSNHAFGLSIDIDPDTNPHIKREVVDVLNEIVKPSGFDYGQRFVEPDPKIPPADWAAQTHLLAAQASNLVKAWLQLHFPRFKPLWDEVKQADQVLRDRKSTAQARKDAKAAREHAIKHMELDVELNRIWILVQHHGNAVERWVTYGVQTVPLYLAVALVKAGLRWGQTYGDSKDGMHFELLVHKVIAKSK